MKWQSLLPPLQRAVRALLLLLDGAVRRVDQTLGQEEHEDMAVTASCFLVYGDRGTGKSTVLLSLKKALNGTKGLQNFFPPVPKETADEGAEVKLLRQAESSASFLVDEGTVWLDVLDLESLPPHANLLSILLTRLHHALYPARGEGNSDELASIIEEEAGSARYQLKRLLNDATLMWEDIQEPDTRNRANRQIAAADIYTRFKDRFRSAMEALSKESGRRKGDGDSYHPVILPIDNIDRSSDHLYNIIKLAQMVASPHLWLVMAGDREDVEAFLTRAYWKELIAIREGGVGIGKVGTHKEDEALVMARRQAAAASHKLLPPSHRIQVDAMKPNETLSFAPLPFEVEDKRTIRALLQEIPIPHWGPGADLKLIELFDVRMRSEDGPATKPEVQGKDKPDAGGTEELNLDKYQTVAARYALHLPARAVLDLWQLSHWVATELSGAKQAEQLARTMLRNTIAESKISNQLGLCLQDNVIHREPDGTTILNLKLQNPDLEICRLRPQDFPSRNFPISAKVVRKKGERKEKKYTVRSTVWAPGREDVVLVYPRGDDFKKQPELPRAVAGWYAVLHDIVVEAEESWIIRGRDKEIVGFVSVKHEVVAEESYASTAPVLWWPSPQWEILVAVDVMWVRYMNFWQSFTEKSLRVVKCPPEYLAWTLAIGWMGCVIDTFWALAPTGKEALGVAPTPLCTGIVSKLTANLQGAQYEKSLLEEERRVVGAAADLYRRIMKASPGQEPVFCTERLTVMRDWLEQKMPLLFGLLYVPMKHELAEKRLGQLENFLAQTEPAMALLTGAWRRSFDFLLADYEIKREEYKLPLELKDNNEDNPFGDLYRLFKGRGSQGE